MVKKNKNEDILNLEQIYEYLVSLKVKGILVDFKETEYSLIESYNANELNIFNEIYAFIKRNVSEDNKNNIDEIYDDVLFEMEKNIVTYGGGGIIEDTIINISNIKYLSKSLKGYLAWHGELWDIKNNRKQSNNMLVPEVSELIKYWGARITDIMYSLLDTEYESEEQKIGIWKELFESFKEHNQITGKSGLVGIANVLYKVKEWDILDIYVRELKFKRKYYKDDEICSNLFKQLDEGNENFKLTIRFEYLSGMGIPNDMVTLIKNRIYDVYKSLSESCVYGVFQNLRIEQDETLDFKIEFSFRNNTSNELKIDLLDYIMKRIKVIYNVEVFHEVSNVGSMDTLEQIMRKNTLLEQMKRQDELISQTGEKEDKDRIKKKL